MATTYHDNVSPPVQYVEAAPTIRTIGLSDLHQALRQGWDDFKAIPSHAIILCVIYPVLGLLLARATFGYAVIPLLFPLAAGFALLGPFAALGLYELSARRERGETPSASDALDVVRSPSFGAMLGLGTAAAGAVRGLDRHRTGDLHRGVRLWRRDQRRSNFVTRVLTTSQGWWLIIVGCGVGFLFALVALCISVVAFPLMLDRHASAGEAMSTSLRLAAQNPVTMAAWGLIVAALLVVGSLPFFLGLAVVIPAARPRHLASLPQGGRDRSQCAADPAQASASAQAGGGLPRQPVPVEVGYSDARKDRTAGNPAVRRSGNSHVLAAVDGNILRCTIRFLESEFPR